jgi:hypothetical protein
MCVSCPSSSNRCAPLLRAAAVLVVLVKVRLALACCGTVAVQRLGYGGGAGVPCTGTQQQDFSLRHPLLDAILRVNWYLLRVGHAGFSSVGVGCNNTPWTHHITAAPVEHRRRLAVHGPEASVLCPKHGISTPRTSAHHLVVHARLVPRRHVVVAGHQVPRYLHHLKQARPHQLWGNQPAVASPA